jgi:AcrR family transcriptional regulator
MPRTSEADRQSKRETIVAAAASVFACQGYLGTRMADIATAADVGKGTLYEYFQSKEKLLFAVWEGIAENAAARIHEASTEGGARAHLGRIFALSADLIIEQVEQHAASMEFWGACRGTAAEADFRTASVETYATFRRIIGDVVRAGQTSGELQPEIDPDAVATAVVSAHDGLGIQYYFDRSLDPHRVMDQFARALCQGLCTRVTDSRGESTS